MGGKNCSYTAKARGRTFLKGPDPRRNVRGQVSRGTVELSALLKKYLTDEGMKAYTGSWSMPASQEKKTKAEALAAVIWEKALDGSFPFIQFLADRILGKVKAAVDLDIQKEVVDNKLIIQVVHTNASQLEAARRPRAGLIPDVIQRKEG